MFFGICIGQNDVNCRFCNLHQDLFSLSWASAPLRTLKNIFNTVKKNFADFAIKSLKHYEQRNRKQTHPQKHQTNKYENLGVRFSKLTTSRNLTIWNRKPLRKRRPNHNLPNLKNLRRKRNRPQHSGKYNHKIQTLPRRLRWENA